MIDFRYHIVSLIAVFLALALGLFLGSTTLQSTVAKNLKTRADAVTSENSQLKGKNHELSGQLSSASQFSLAVEPYAVAGQLTGEGVAVISAPGVSGDDRKGLETALTQAGATVSVDLQLQSSYLDPTQDSELGFLANSIKPPGHRLPRGNGATQASDALANVLLTRPGRKAVSGTRIQQALNAMSDGKFIKVSGPVPTRAADLALLLLAPATTGADPATSQAQNAILVSLGGDLHAASAGEVIIGPNDSKVVSGGAFAAVLADPTVSKEVSTVAQPAPDESPAPDPVPFRIAAVLALADVSGGPPTAYGAGNAPLPTISPTP